MAKEITRKKWEIVRKFAMRWLDKVRRRLNAPKDLSKTFSKEALRLMTILLLMLSLQTMKVSGLESRREFWTTRSNT